MSLDATLPEGWVQSDLGTVAVLAKEKADPQSMPDTPYLGLEHIEAHTMRIVGMGRGADVKSAKTKFTSGDVLYGKLRPYLNKVARPDFDGICSTDILVFAESPELDNGFLANYLNQLWIADRAHNESTGVELPRVNWKVLSRLPIAYPPDKAAQRGVACAINKAREKQARIQEGVCRANQAILRLRQAVLAAACSGRLTADWRETHEATHPADELLSAARDRQERHAGSRFKEPTANKYATYPDLPDEWVISPLGVMLKGLRYGTSKKSDYGVSGVPVLRIPNVSSGRVDLNDLKYSELDEKEVAKLSLQRSDVLMIRSNGTPELVGASVLVGEAAEGMAYAGYLMRLRADSEVLDPAYLTLAISTPQVRRQIEMPLRSTSGVNNINSEEVRSLVVPLPSLDEQREIVRQTSALMKKVDSIEARIASAESRIDAAPQAVLARAFRGELAAQGQGKAVDAVSEGQNS